MIISSQKYIDQEIVAEKIANNDFRVSIASVGAYDVVVDGHHSLEAARQAGVSPEYDYLDKHSAYQQELDYIVDLVGQEKALEQIALDGEYYDIETGLDVF